MNFRNNIQGSAGCPERVSAAFCFKVQYGALPVHGESPWVESVSAGADEY